ncbi:Ig-like domain-containing protein [Myxococcus sp. SDU36]|uniref:adventurous gliding motility protein AgmC n=1 Tax=Myxococcus sp. SDU36 TaxID=2831967 RepID=UPI002542FA5F|nr:Ig-like domain-containing protein [Myxococcus sp. SDU36]WIG98271.1 hypothetical protein KGD87_13300 [Myxococcus sp. SDU36]
MRTNALTKALTAAMVLWALPALPGPDTYLVGNGQDGARNITNVNGGTVINNYAQVLEPLAPGDTTLRTSLATDTSTTPDIPDFNGPEGGGDIHGDLVMIIQTTGLVPAATAGSAAPINLEGSAVGRWELARIINVDRSVEDELTLTLDRPLKHSYAVEVTQVVRVPEYTTLSLAGNAEVRARTWDPETYTGGVLAFLATGNVTLANGSRLSAKGAGFRGGTYARDTTVDGDDEPLKGCPASGRPDSTRALSGEGLNAATNSPRGVDNVANGGGGGVCLQAGGGGGGNGGAGGRGGSSESVTDDGRGAAAGKGGAALNASPLMQLLMGGGGGAGHGRSASPTPHGGHGGGIVFVRAQTLSGGVMEASGNVGVASDEDGAGGGGAGGTIHARFLQATACGTNNFLDVRGGAGGATTHNDGEVLRGPGGGGGGGRVLFQSQNTATCGVNTSSGTAGLAVTGNRHGAVPSASSFPHTGVVTLMGTEFVAPASPTITDPAGAIVTRNPLPTLSGTGTANAEVVIYALNGGVVSGLEFGRGVVGANASFSVTLSRPLPTGPTTLVAVTEAQGLQGPPSNSRVLTVDTDAPDTFFAEGGVPVTPTKEASVTFTFASNEATGITYQCQVVPGSGTTAPSSGWATCLNPYTTPNPDDTTYTIWVKAVDAAQNEDPTPARYTWLVDQARPETAFASEGTPGAFSNLVNPVFRFTSEANATFECILVSPGSETVPEETDARWAACTNPYVAPARTHESTNTLWVRAKDLAANVDDTPASHPWTVDLVDPGTDLVEPLPAPVNNLGSVSFTFSSNESNVDFECSLNNGPFDACPSGGNFATPDLEASFSLLVRARDRAGNVDKTPARFAWRTDKSRPDTELQTTIGGLSGAHAGFDFNSPDADVVGFECILLSSMSAPEPDEEDDDWASCAASYLTPALTNSTYRLWVRAVDAAGNVDDTPASHGWEADVTPPNTNFMGPLPAPVNNLASVIIAFNSNESNVDFECSLNNEPFAECTSGSSIATPGVDAEFRFLVRAKDRAGNVDPTPAAYAWRTDKSRPDTELQTTIGGLSGAHAGFDFNSPDADVVGFECILLSPMSAPEPDEEDDDWASCAASYLTPELTNSTYRLWVRAVDAAGNVDDTPASHGWEADVTPPNTNFMGPLPAPVNNLASVIIAFNSNESNVDFECSLNNEPFDECTSGSSIATPGVNAEFRFLVRAKDRAGNVDPTPAAHAWRTDKSRPDTQVAALVDALSNVRHARFNLSSTDGDVVGFQCILVGLSSTTPPDEGDDDWEACAASYLTPELTTSAYTLWARAVDAAGNVDASPARHEWTVDLLSPDTRITAKPVALTREQTAVFEFDSLDPDTVGFECSYDGTPFSPCESPYTLPNEDISIITEGEHTMLIRAVDAAGNRDETPSNHNWRVVVAEVETEIVDGPTTVTRQTTASFAFTSNLSNVIYACQLDSEPREDDCATSADPTKTYTDLSEGAHTLRVWAREGAREDPSPEIFDWTIDQTGPVAPVVTSPSANGAYVNIRRPTIAGQAPESGTIIIRINGDIVGTLAGVVSTVGWTFTRPVDMADGTYELAVSLTDEVGNAGAQTFRTFTLDATKPETQLTVMPPTLTNQPRAVFQFESNEEGSTFECSLNGGTFAACTGANSHEVTVGDATHTFVVRAKDRAGNVADVQGSHTWRVDSLAPVTNIVEFPAADTNVPQAVFRFESDEAPVTFQCSIDGAAFDNCPSAYTWDGVPEGEHRIEVRAHDEAGNVDATPAVHVWRLDMTPPAAPVVSSPAPDAVVGSLTPTFQGTAEPGTEVLLFIDGLDFGSVRVEPSGQWRLTLTRAISEGDHTVSARTQDAAGNIGERSGESAFKVDPSINIVREVSSRGGGLSCAAGGQGSAPLMLLGWGALVLMAARRRRV